MLTCPKCHAGVPEGMRFCLQCGASLAPTPPPPAPPVGICPPMPAASAAPPAAHAAPAPPAPVTAPPPQKAASTVHLKIAPTPVMAPRPEAAAEYARPSLGDQMEEADDEWLKKSFERPVAPPGAVVCRFCKGPLDLAGEFCEQCGAPVTEAAPPGTLKPQPQPAAPPVPPPVTPAPPPRNPAQAAPRLPAKPAVLTGPTHPMPRRTPAPVVPTSPITPPAEEHPSGFVGRLKGLFKKG